MSRLTILCVMVAGCFSLALLAKSVEATTIYVHNQCGNTVCAKYWVPNNGVGGACSEQGPGGTWTFGASDKWVGGVVWAILNTGCSGQACNTGPPGGVTLFEITVDGSGGNDYYDISTLSGYNVAMKVVPTNGGCTVVDCGGNTAATCPQGFYPGGPDETKACTTGTDYNIYLC
eukprot:c34258_g1_i1 orf=1-519(-)